MPEPGERRRLPVWALAAGLYLAVAALYVLSSPGRIDIVDGQIRFEVSDSLVREGRPVLRDPFLEPLGTRGPDGETYAAYGAGASIAGLPLVWLGGLADDPGGERRRFLYSLTTPLVGAAIAPLLMLFYLELGLDRRRAVAWALVAAFASLLWPGSTTVFDQAQHAFLVLLAIFLGFVAARRDSLVLAAAGGLAAGLLLTYLEPYALLLPLLAASTLGGAEASRRGRDRWLVFMAATLVGVALWMAYNWLCFDNPFIPGKLRPTDAIHPAGSRNLLRGLAGLLASPGKSVFLYSPTLVLGLAGFGELWRHRRELATAILLTSAVHLIFFANMSFWHGEWCWGPRYLLVLLPLWALPAPFAWRRRRWLVGAVVAAGLAVQLLGLAVVHERFFHERSLGAFFWARDTGFHFRESALFARPGEILALAGEAGEEPALGFSPNPYDSPTYFIVGPPRPREGPELVRRYRVFQVPRPWPLWTALLGEGYAPPVPPGRWIAALVALLVGGAALVVVGTRRAPARAASGGAPAAG